MQLGFVALARTTFDIALAQTVACAARDGLRQAGYSLAGPSELVTDGPGVQAASAALAEAPIELLVIFQATFADSSAAVALAEAVSAPLLLWAVPEARTGGRLRLNSLCGINLAAHALTLRRRPYEYVYAAPTDAAALAKVGAVAAAARVARRLRKTRLAVIGQHPAGFDSCRLDSDLLRERLGVQVVQLDLPPVFAQVRGLDGAQLAPARQRLAARLDNLEALDPGPVAGTLGVYTALRQLAAEQGFAALAVRCWPEFFTDLGCAACGAMAMLNTDQIPCGCEADANGTLTQLMLQWLTGEPAFGTDLVEFNPAEDSAVVWHCGQAPLTMADPAAPIRGGVHSNRQVPLVMEFTLKPGRVTLARLSQAGGGLRLVVGSGEMLPAPPSFSGTSGVIRFDRPAQAVLDTILSHGLEHHLALAYGDHVPPLLALARLLDLPVLAL